METSPLTTSFTSLPNEIVTRVCKLFDSQPDLYNLIRGSQNLYIIAEKLLYTSFAIDDGHFPYTSLEAFAMKPVRCTWVRHLTIRYTLDYMSAACRPNEQLIASVLNELPNLEELDVSLL
jgi:hypothetical protein